MSYLNLKLGCFALIALSVTPSFGSIKFTEYKLGTMTLNSGAYAQDDGKRLGPLQQKEIETSDGQFRLTPGKVINLSNVSEVASIPGEAQILKIFSSLYDIAAKQYLKSQKNINIGEILTRSEAERLNKRRKSKGAVEEYEPLKNMFHQRTKVKVYVLGKKNLLIAGPISDFTNKILVDKVMLLDNLFNYRNRLKPILNKAKNNKKEIAQLELELIKTNNSYIKALNALPQDYDIGAVQSFVKTATSSLGPYYNENALKELKSLQNQDFLLISFSKDINQAFEKASISGNDYPWMFSELDHETMLSIRVNALKVVL